MRFPEVKKLLMNAVRTEAEDDNGDMCYTWRDTFDDIIATGRQRAGYAVIKLLCGTFQKNQKRRWRGDQADQLLKCGQTTTNRNTMKERTCTWQPEISETVAACTFTN
jgi:hypothetical protein